MKRLIFILLLVSCSTEPIDDECLFCEEIYWEYVKPREYQEVDRIQIQCRDSISIKEAADNSLPRENIIQIKCYYGL